MRVRAKRLGYYGTKRKREGEKFDISDLKKNEKDEFPMAFSKAWMENLEEEKSEAPSKVSKAKPAKGKAKEVDLDVI